MKAYGWFKKEIEKVKGTLEYELADLEMELTENILRIMERKKITRSKLAEKLNVSKAYISKLLSNGSNMTLKRILTISNELDCDFMIKLEERKAVALPATTCKYDDESYIRVEVPYNSRRESHPSIFVDKNKISMPDDYHNINLKDDRHALDAA